MMNKLKKPYNNSAGSSHSNTFQKSSKLIDSIQVENETDSIQNITYAVRTIERAYCSYRDRQMFRLLKHSICAAEHSLSKEILKKIAPQESNLLNDPIFKVKIKFRFSGPEYPPFIVFKIYTNTHDGRSAKYINGKNTIKASTSAAKEACNHMGNRKYYELIILDKLQEQNRGKIVDPESVISLRDYMQYSSVIDDMPAYMGGRSNTWRRLNLTDLPRHTIFYDVLNYALTKKMTKSLKKELPILLMPPTNPDIQFEQIKIISKLESSEDDTITNASMSLLHKSSSYKNSLSQVSSRRSKNAMSKALRMKKAYAMARSETLTTEVDLINSSVPVSEPFKLPDDLNDDFEKEVKNLYMWTQNLSINDDYLNSPRLPSAYM